MIGVVLCCGREAEMRMNFDGLMKSNSCLGWLLSPFIRLGLASLEKMETGSTFSTSSSSYMAALRLEGDDSGIARRHVRFMIR